MNKALLNRIYLFAGLIFLQITLFNYIHIHGFISSFIYIIFILSLPVKINKTRLLLLSFLLGFIVDVLSNSGGIHAFSSILIAYIRPFLLNNLMPGGKLEEDAPPNLEKLGFVSFLIYAGVLTFIHHFCINLLDAYTLADFAYTFIKSFLSSVLSLVVIFLHQQFIKK
jgi:hypothetical protein